MRESTARRVERNVIPCVRDRIIGEHQKAWGGRVGGGIGLGPAGNAPDWQGSDNRLGCLVRDSEAALCLLFNAAPDRCRFIMPAPPGSGWQVVIDTSKEDPTADTSPGTEHGVNSAYEIWLEARSTIVAICRSMEA